MSPKSVITDNILKLAFLPFGIAVHTVDFPRHWVSTASPDKWDVLFKCYL